MPNYVYETHAMNNPLLPFIFHRSFVVTQRQGLPNWHENIELLYCTGGAGYIQCGLERWDFTEGNLFAVNANTPHCIASEGSVRYCCLIIDNVFCEENGIPAASLRFQNDIRDPEMNMLFEQVREAFDRYGEGEAFAVADVRYTVLGLLRGLCRKYLVSDSVPASSPANEHVKNALNYIRKNMSGSISLNALSDSVGVSKYHLSREFKAFTGKTIVQTINLIRCEEARRLIEGGESVSAAAVSCGFENMSYFSRTFKKIFHGLPSDYLQGGSRKQESR